MSPYPLALFSLVLPFLSVARAAGPMPPCLASAGRAAYAEVTADASGDWRSIENRFVDRTESNVTWEIVYQAPPFAARAKFRVVAHLPGCRIDAVTRVAFDATEARPESGLAPRALGVGDEVGLGNERLDQGVTCCNFDACTGARKCTTLPPNVQCGHHSQL